MKENYPNPIKASLQSIIYDCPDPARLAEFYARLLGSAVETDPYGGFSVPIPGLGIDLAFQEDKFYERPVWLGQKKDQQPMVHLDLRVEDRQEAIRYALLLGAELPAEQFCQPEWDVQWTTLLDPAGHPFCLFDDED